MCSTTFINYIIPGFGAGNIDPILDIVSEMQNMLCISDESPVYITILSYTL